MQESNFRLLYPKISAEGDPNCIGKRSGTGCPVGHIFNTFASKFYLIEWPIQVEIVHNWFGCRLLKPTSHNPWSQINTSVPTRFTGHCLCRCYHSDFYCRWWLVSPCAFTTIQSLKHCSHEESSVYTSTSICVQHQLRHHYSVQSFISHIMSVPYWPDLLERKKAGFLLHHIRKWSLFIWWKVCVCGWVLINTNDSIGQSHVLGWNNYYLSFVTSRYHQSNFIS